MNDEDHASPTHADRTPPGAAPAGASGESRDRSDPAPAGGSDVGCRYRDRTIGAVVFDMGNTLLEFETETWSELNRRGAGASWDVLCERWPDLRCERDDFVRSFEAAFARLETEALKTDSGLHLNDVFLHVLEEIVAPGDEEPTSWASSPTHLHALTEGHYRPIVSQVSLYPEAMAALTQLKARGLRLGIVSNTVWPASYHLNDLDRFGILSFFDVTVFSTDVGLSKPHPGIFRHCLDALGVRPEETIFVGDRPREDVGGAQALGMLGVLKAHPMREPDPRFRPDARIESLLELLELISPSSG